MTRPSPRRAAAAIVLVGLALLLLPTAGHAVPRPEKTGSAAPFFERALSGLLDRFTTLLPGSTASKRGSSIDPDGSTTDVDRGSGLDPNGATSDRGSSLDPNGRT